MCLIWFIFCRSAHICFLKSVGVFFISSENGVHVWIGFGNSKQILLQSQRCNEFFYDITTQLMWKKCIIALWSSNHTSMCIFRSHNNFNWFFFNRWNHEEIWNCSNILLNLYDIYRNNCLYYQVISNVFRSKCYLLWIEKKYKGSMLGPLLFLVYINDIVQDIQSNICPFCRWCYFIYSCWQSHPY